MEWISVKDKLPKDVYPITDVYEYAKKHYSKEWWGDYKGELRCETEVIVGCYSEKENKITGVYLASMMYIPRLGWLWCYSDDYLTDDQITHWMPLPEPPKN